MINLDALKAELEAARLNCKIESFTRRWSYGDEPSIRLDFVTLADEGMYICVGSWGNLIASVDSEEAFAALAIIARHVAPVVTPEPDAEARDVLAEALKVYYGIPADERAPEADGIADAGLAALRARGFAVVRAADVEAALDLALGGEEHTPETDRLKEAIR